ALAAGGSGLGRALAALSRGSAREAGDLLPGGRGRRCAAESGREHGRGAPAQGQSGRLFPILGRAAWLPEGRQHPTLPRCGTCLLCDRSLSDRAHVLTQAAMSARAGWRGTSLGEPGLPMFFPRLIRSPRSARASSVSATVRPSALAVLRLIASSYLVGACTGRSAGFSPLRILRVGRLRPCSAL